MGGSQPSRPRDWDARTYDRVADPMTRWGSTVLDRLPLRGDERVLDAGCGSGRVTQQLADRLPRGHVVALDGLTLATAGVQAPARARAHSATAWASTPFRARIFHPAPWCVLFTDPALQARSVVANRCQRTLPFIDDKGSPQIRSIPGGGSVIARTTCVDANDPGAPGQPSIPEIG